MKAGRKRLQALILKRLIFLVHFVGDRKVPRSLLGRFHLVAIGKFNPSLIGWTWGWSSFSLLLFFLGWGLLLLGGLLLLWCLLPFWGLLLLGWLL